MKNFKRVLMTVVILALVVICNNTEVNAKEKETTDVLLRIVSGECTSISNNEISNTEKGYLKLWNVTEENVGSLNGEFLKLLKDSPDSKSVGLENEVTLEFLMGLAKNANGIEEIVSIYQGYMQCNVGKANKELYVFGVTVSEDNIVKGYGIDLDTKNVSKISLNAEKTSWEEIKRSAKSVNQNESRGKAMKPTQPIVPNEPGIDDTPPAPPTNGDEGIEDGDVDPDPIPAPEEPDIDTDDGGIDTDDVDSAPEI